MAGRREPLDPHRVHQVRVEREVELDVAGARPDGIGHQAALDLDRRSTNASSSRTRRPGTVVNGWAKIEAAGNVTLNGTPPATSLMKAASRSAGESTASSGSRSRALQLDGLAAIVAERDGLTGRDAADGIVEGVHEHPPAELAVGHHVEAAVDLPPDCVADRQVLAARSSVWSRSRSSSSAAECPSA